MFDFPYSIATKVVFLLKPYSARSSEFYSFNLFPENNCQLALNWRRYLSIVGVLFSYFYTFPDQCYGMMMSGHLSYC